MSGCIADYNGGGIGGGGSVIHVGGVSHAGGGHQTGVIVNGGGGVHHSGGVVYGGGSIAVETVKESLSDRLTGKITSFFDRLTESFQSVKQKFADSLPPRQATHVTSEL